MPIKIDFLANVRDFLRGTDDVEDALDDVSDSLDDTAREGEKSSEKLEASFRELARRARDTADDVDTIGTKGQSGFRRLGDTGREISGELKQNLGETFSSFRGDLEDLPQIAQDTLGGLAGSGALGGIPGLIATTVGAAGLGLLIGTFDKAGQASEESAARAGEWAQAYVEAGGRIISSATTTATALDIATDPKRFEEAKTNAKNWGVDVSTAIAAMAGESWALNAANEGLASTERMIREEMEQTGIQYPKLVENLTDVTLEASAGRTALDQLTGEMERGGQQADAYSGYLRAVAENTAGATTKVDEFGDSVTTLPDGTVVYIDAETGRATSNVDAIERKVYGLPDGSVTVNAKDNVSREVDRIIVRNSGRYVTIGTRVGRAGAVGEF